MKKSRVLFLLLLASCVIPATQAHHSFAEFDRESTITITGVVTEFRLVNPHTNMFFDVTEDNGEVRQWRVEFDGRLNLSRAGWVPETINAGESITITGNPAASGSPYMFFLSGVKGDGTELVRPIVDDRRALDELRSQRREARQNATP